ncbi:MAG: lysophospholipid acyltransferase family protein [Syntrophaceae bacterium]|nr:lysophospholipid acyltransferase family protein [Syntrophaceae bacterium]
MIAYLIYLLLRGFHFFINLLPEGFALWLGRQLGRLVYHLDRGHQRVALQNLEIAFGQEKTKEEMRSIAKKTFQNLGMMTVEFFRIPKMNVITFKERVNIEGLEGALSLLEKKKGVLLLIGHFGNWELMGMMSRVIGNPIMVIAKPMKNNRWVDQFITKIRNAGGLEVISSIKAGRKVIQALSQNRIVGILIDQRAKRSEGVWADFFKRKAPTTPALAVLAMKTGAPVVPVFLIRNGFQKHRLIIKAPLELIRTGDIKRDVEANTQLFNDTLESMIRQYPDQWFWIHRRWERKRGTSHR